MITNESKVRRAIPKGSLTITSDHALIKGWAEAHNARPASVKGTSGNDIGTFRLMFPGYSSGGSQPFLEISWDEFFRKFDENNLSFIYQDETIRRVKSNFNRFIKRSI